MTKKEMDVLLHSLSIPINEGIQNDKDTNNYPRIVFFENTWEPMVASEEKYTDKVNYQISFFSREPRDKKLLELKKILANKNLNPIIYHEYIQDERYFHSFFSLEVLENVIS